MNHRISLLLVFVFLWATCSREISWGAESHITANIPGTNDFRPFLIRDLTSYFTPKYGKDLKLDYELLRDTPTQWGSNEPEFYLWLRATNAENKVIEGAVRVGAVEKKRFDVTCFMLPDELISSADQLVLIFPEELIEKILTKAAGAALAGDLSVDLKVDTQTLMQIRLSIKGDFATATVGDEKEVFNLKQMSWLDTTNGWVTLEHCKKWVEQSKTKSKKGIDSAPEHLRAFLVWSLSPTFNVEKSNSNLRLTSGQVDYIIEGKVTSDNVDGYFRYAALNAYKKAMVEKKLPPFSELKAIDEMKKLGHIPRTITVTMPGIPKSPVIEMIISE